MTDSNAIEYVKYSYKEYIDNTKEDTFTQKEIAYIRYTQHKKAQQEETKRHIKEMEQRKDIAKKEMYNKLMEIILNQ